MKFKFYTLYLILSILLLFLAIINRNENIDIHNLDAFYIINLGLIYTIGAILTGFVALLFWLLHQYNRPFNVTIGIFHLCFGVVSVLLVLIPFKGLFTQTPNYIWSTKTPFYFCALISFFMSAVLFMLGVVLANFKRKKL